MVKKLEQKLVSRLMSIYLNDLNNNDAYKEVLNNKNLAVPLLLFRSFASQSRKDCLEAGFRTLLVKPLA